MRKNDWLYIILSVFLLTLSACTDDSGRDPATVGKEIQVHLKVSVPTWIQDTRATGATVDETIRDFQLLCFDKDGYFIGRRKVTFSKSLESDGDYVLSGTIPSTTCRIHFVANGNFSSFNDTESMGVSENVLIPSLNSSMKDSQMTYWGYKRFSTSDEMFNFLNSGTNTIYLLRDRAEITVDNETSDIQSVDFAVCNGLEKGTMAPFDKNHLDAPFAYNDSVGVKYVTEPEDQSKFPTPQDVLPNTPSQYVFEEPNSSSDPLAVILKVTYKDGSVKYYKILLENAEFNMLPIIRNHEYRIVIKKLALSLGYDSFIGALNGDAANDPFLYVDDIIPGISNDNSTLTITNGTTQVFHASGEQTIDFKYVSTLGNIDTSSFQVGWLSDNGVADPSVCSVTSYDATTGDGKVTIKLNDVSSIAQFGTLYLKDKTGLVRRIHIVSIDNFSFGDDLAIDPPSNVGTDAGSEVKLTFTVPSYYPDALMPLEIKFASNDLNPTDKNNLGVSVESTADINQPWNFWYTFYATEKKTYNLIFKTVRKNNPGDTGELYIKAGDFETKELTFTY
ncbi:hypothetical protein NG821_08695 [Prevotella cerevisiae]|uniref:Uncharacterized protein n=1 Tax=Segatella cerevisiae TaxID=2053716 RepID=A0ABT1BXV3_9BACT|nr:hypothetical protein [Segatella cerevisiae]MCO6025911.1 hypothetical protein [Segatella cerevisiae]